MARNRSDLPTFDSLMNPLLQAMRELGGSGRLEEIYNMVVDNGRFSEEQLAVMHKPGESSQSEIEYKLAWTRTYLRKYGLLENSSRGVWSLTPAGNKTVEVVPKQVVAAVRAMDPKSLGQEAEEIAHEGEPEVVENWRVELRQILQSMPPAAFEKLAQRLLREAGFSQVEVTGRSGDKGIDGKGVFRVNGLLSFRMIFQCKRYQGSVGPSEIRDFRGAMDGRADNGLFITTGSFTREAMREAVREGALAIDLVDGEQLLDKLKELSLGVETQQRVFQEILVSKEWFEALNV